MRMNTAFPFSLVLPVLILFSIDPDTSLVANNAYKQNYRDVAISEDKDKTKYKIQNGEHFCPRCESHSLAFESLNTSEGKQIQLINCKTCEYEWQEAWTLPNWFWLKSSSPDNHWTSGRWNTEPFRSEIQDLELAQGIKDSLEEAGFHTVASLLKESPLDISDKLGIDPYVAHIIKEAVKRA
jgi:hypothetical protein